MKPTSKDENYPIVAPARFIEAIRDAGYRGTSSAVAELTDNAIQAHATKVSITIRETDDRDWPLEVCVADDGVGMPPATLARSLQFGGSTRFNDRGGLGRYGMGLPSSSLSQARRVSVYTWQRPGRVFATQLDIDEVVSGNVEEIPQPRPCRPPEAADGTKSGTFVIWSRCDRLDSSRISTLASRLEASLGRWFRYFIWEGFEITVNGSTVGPIDPLHLHPNCRASGAHQFGEMLEYEVRASPEGGTSAVGSVRVRFAELPVHEWGALPNDEKRRLGVTRGAGVSIVRAGREIDHGWFFMGSKRRENYDDWWRCEVAFDPVLDEVFQVTHTKQQVRPTQYLRDVLTPDIETTARVLNSRARKAHLDARSTARYSDIEKLAADRDRRLPPLAGRPSPRAVDRFAALAERYPHLRNGSSRAKSAPTYTVLEAAVRDMAFFTYALEGSHFVLVVNPDHPFYRDVYYPLASAQGDLERQIRSQIDLLLLAAARTEAAQRDEEVRELLAQNRLRWSNTLAALMNG